MMNENASKIRFMECKMAGQPYKFVLQTTHPQYLYQVLEFKDMEQFRKFTQSDAAKNELFRQVSSRMIALRMSSCLQNIDLRQDKVEDLTKQLYDTIHEATKWYDEFLSEQESIKVKNINSLKVNNPTVKLCHFVI